MKYILQSEELAQLVLGIVILYYQPLQLTWWLWIVLFLSPDISMLGYVLNARAGAFTYNLFHHKGIAIIVAASGYFTGNNWLMLSGIVLFTHSSFDRVMGYGLKYEDDFKHTHLGWMKKKN
jgi:hypothetical protein